MCMTYYIYFDCSDRSAPMELGVDAIYFYFKLRVFMYLFVPFVCTHTAQHQLLAVFVARRYRNQQDPFAELPARAVFPQRNYVY